MAQRSMRKARHPGETATHPGIGTRDRDAGVSDSISILSAGRALGLRKAALFPYNENRSGTRFGPSAKRHGTDWKRMMTMSHVTVPNDLESLWMPFTANRQFKRNPAFSSKPRACTISPRMDAGTAGLWCELLAKLPARPVFAFSRLILLSRAWVPGHLVVCCVSTTTRSRGGDPDDPWLDPIRSLAAISRGPYSLRWPRRSVLSSRRTSAS